MDMDRLHRHGVCGEFRGPNSARSSGFTLVELIVSIAILGILSGIAFPLYTGYIEKTRDDRAITDIIKISLVLAKHYADYGAYPQSLSDVGFGTYADPWGHPYRYLDIETANPGQMRKDRFLVPINSDYDLYSMGSDGKSLPPLTAKFSRDDIIRADDGAYIGLAYAF